MAGGGYNSQVGAWHVKIDLNNRVQIAFLSLITVIYNCHFDRLQRSGCCLALTQLTKSAEQKPEGYEYIFTFILFYVNTILKGIVILKGISYKSTGSSQIKTSI